MNKILASSNEVILKQKELLTQDVEDLKEDLKKQIGQEIFLEMPMVLHINLHINLIGMSALV